MRLRPLTADVPREVEDGIREVMDYLDVEKAQAVRLLLEIGIYEWRTRTAIELLREGKVTFAKAARVAKLDLWDFAELLKQRKVEWAEISANSGSNRN